MTQPLPSPGARVAVLQSNYIPWKGYFDIIHDVDLFIFYDDVQYTKNDWRNRNRVKSRTGAEWITIPAGDDGKRLICEVELRDSSWQAKHWRTLCQNYSRTPHFARYAAYFEDFYLGRRWSNLSQLNQALVRHIASEFLGITTQFAESQALPLEGRKQDRLLDLLVACHAKVYISGPAARAYVDADRFEAAGIELVWKDYGGYPEYPQRHPPFEHGVTVLDLLFNVGPDAPHYIWGWRDGAAPASRAG